MELFSFLLTLIPTPFLFNSHTAPMYVLYLKLARKKYRFYRPLERVKNSGSFELVFDGATEKFAAPSIRDRASWVSTIWDAILLKQESRSIYRSEHSEKLPSFTQPESIANFHLADVSKPLPQPVEERSLPSLPPPSESDSLNFKLLTAFLLLCLYATSRSANLLHAYRQSLHIVSRCLLHLHFASTSIANLSKRSMVKQRLAQMERDYSETSVISSPLSPRRNRPLPSPHSMKGSTDTIKRTNSGDSIVESYSYFNPTNYIPKATYWSRPAVSPIAEDLPRETGTEEIVYHAAVAAAGRHSRTDSTPQ
ncbi:hypothetical protein BT96DRAFT_2028 [Gymnopus androsaceus JB14]|uniref:PH domain-containing protein n=1 Tax=Gymnopus androsaceus JB14 TaxID=1447944 RepID=A0A6A4IUF5_9AGAR|nr:hypothetical protein BT96DRAFT_2028 [Gymnopus androsaceus JB14]